MNDTLIDELKTVITHASHQEPASNVWVLLHLKGVLALGASIDVECGEVARELAAILGDEAPLGEFFELGSLYKKTADLVAPELEPKHVIGQVEEKVILLGVLLE